MKMEVSALQSSLKNEIIKFNTQPQLAKEFFNHHQGPYFAELNSQLYDLLKQIQVIKRIKINELAAARDHIRPSLE
jgi:hypothetical protein